MNELNTIVELNECIKFYEEDLELEKNMTINELIKKLQIVQNQYGDDVIVKIDSLYDYYTVDSVTTHYSSTENKQIVNINAYEDDDDIVIEEN